MSIADTVANEVDQENSVGSKTDRVDEFLDGANINLMSSFGPKKQRKVKKMESGQLVGSKKGL
jgi:hypothetical protein